MYILKHILISLHSAVFPQKNFVEIIFLYENPSIRQFVANDAAKNRNIRARLDILKN